MSGGTHNMIDYAYNGWPVIHTPARGQLVELKVRTESFGKVLAGDVWEVLSYVAEQLDLRVEKVDLGHPQDDWAYFVKKNTNNKTQWSCHAAACAFDYNAVRHVNGKRDTWTKEQEAEIRRILAEVFNVVRCLWDHDEMHFEICAPADKVAEAAKHVRLLRAGKAPVVPKGRAGKPVLKLGSAGDAVKILQAKLKKDYPAYAGSLTVDGDFGAKTEAAVIEFQKRSKLMADGVVGNKTWTALGL